MNPAPTPPAFTPCFIVLGAERFLSFLVDALGGEETSRCVRDDGLLGQAQVLLGSTRLLVREASGRYSPMCGAYQLYVENADATMARMLLHGATIESIIEDLPNGERQGGAVDPFGNLWWIAQRAETPDLAD